MKKTLEIVLAAFLSVSLAKSQAAASPAVKDSVMAEASGDIDNDGIPENAKVIRHDSKYEIMLTTTRTKQVMRFKHLKGFAGLRFVKDKTYGNYFIYFMSEGKNENGKITARGVEVRFNTDPYFSYYYLDHPRNYDERQYLLMLWNSL
jgi:hypothetical protein